MPGDIFMCKLLHLQQLSVSLTTREPSGNFTLEIWWHLRSCVYVFITVFLSILVYKLNNNNKINDNDNNIIIIMYDFCFMCALWNEKKVDIT